MYKNLKGLIALTAITSIGIGSVLHNQVAYAQDQEISSSQTTTTPSSVQVNIEDQSNNNNEIYVENYIDEKEVTTPGGAEINDIPAEIQQKYSDYFESNKDVKSIEDIINKLFKSLNDIDVKNNPNFSSLKDGEVPYSILSDIQKDGYSLDDKTMNSIKDSTDFFDVYSELSKDGGYVYHSYSSSSDFESVDDIVSNFLFKYDYTKIVDPEQFKQEIETKLNNEFKMNYNKYDDTIFQVPTVNSTGYVYISAELMNGKGDIFTFNYETILQKLKPQSSSSSSGGSHHHSSGGSSSGGSKSSSSNSTTTSNTSENTNTQNTTPVANNISIVTEENAKILKDSNGNTLTGWQKDINGNWYLANSKGEIQTGWYQDNNGSWYLLREDGAMKRGWYQNDNGTWYLLREDGAMATGWYKNTDNKWYYLNSDGSMAANTTVNGYAVGADGAWVQ